MRARKNRPAFVALIPARAGSKRVQGKNVRPLAGHPLLAYSIAAARHSGCFSAVVVSTDSPEYRKVAEYYGAEVPRLRPGKLAGDLSPDIDWVEFTLQDLARRGRRFDGFSILRPTSPCRLPQTIRRAFDQFLQEPGADSLRAVEPCSQHPGKMWVIQGRTMIPLLPFSRDGLPWHSTPYQGLPRIHVQNASLEIAWSRVVEETRSIAGQVILPFETVGTEGFDLNHPGDWAELERLLALGEACLPEITHPPFPNKDRHNP